MKDLKESLEAQEKNHGFVDSDYHPLQQVAKRWASHSLNTYTGKLLKRALAISAALGDFTAELSMGNPELYKQEIESEKLSQEVDRKTLGSVLDF